MSALALLCRHVLGARPLHADNGRTGSTLLTRCAKTTYGPCRVHGMRKLASGSIRPWADWAMPSSPAAFLASERHCSHCIARAPSSMPRSWHAGKTARLTSAHSTPATTARRILRLVLRSPGGEDRRSLPVIARKQSSRRSCAETIIVCPALGSLQERRAAFRPNAGSAASKASPRRRSTPRASRVSAIG